MSERRFTRADCAGLPRPCPMVMCRYHLGVDLPSCALDVADEGGVTLEIIANIIGLTRERVRQIEEQALDKIRLALPRHELAQYGADDEAEAVHAAARAGVEDPDPGQASEEARAERGVATGPGREGGRMSRVPLAGPCPVHTNQGGGPQ